jgi:hypothetical protein
MPLFAPSSDRPLDPCNYVGCHLSATWLVTVFDGFPLAAGATWDERAEYRVCSAHVGSIATDDPACSVHVMHVDVDVDAFTHPDARPRV